MFSQDAMQVEWLLCTVEKDGELFCLPSITKVCVPETSSAHLLEHIWSLVKVHQGEVQFVGVALRVPPGVSNQLELIMGVP